MNRDRFLVAHGVDASKWASRFGIDPASAPCYQCGVELHTTLPFAVGNMRGLMSPACECGFTGTPYCLVGAKGDLFGEILRHPTTPGDE